MRNPTVDRVLHACEPLLRVETFPNAFTLSESDVENLAELAAILRAAEAACQTAAADYHAAVTAKDAAMAEADATLSRLARVALASRATGSDLAGVGLARPAPRTRPQSLPAPEGLLAIPVPGGGVSLTWRRGGNAERTVFEILAAPDGLDLRIVETTTRTRVTLRGYAPGEACWFKVRARRAGLISPLSNAVSVYHGSEGARQAA